MTQWDPSLDGMAKVFDATVPGYVMTPVLGRSCQTVAASGAAKTVDVRTYGAAKITLTASCTLTVTGAISGQLWTLTLLLVQGGSGSYTVTWPTTTLWAAGSAPTLTTTVGGKDLVMLSTIDGGTTWYGRSGGLAFA